MEVPRLGLELELHLLTYATATATQNPSHVCNLHHRSWQHQILNPLSEARDQTHILMDTSQIQSLCQQPLSFALRSLWPQGPSSKCSLYLKQYLFTWKKPIEPNSFFHSLHCLSCLPFFSSKCLRFLKIIFNFISPIPKPMSFKCSKNIYRIKYSHLQIYLLFAFPS